MAIINMARGGQPDFKGWMCAGQWPEYGAPYDAQHLPDTPPYDSHADAAHGQGYLNLHFPLVPHLAETRAHAWMQHALKGITKVGDVFLTNWVPLRSYIESVFMEVSRTDKLLDGVYIKPVAYRMKWNFQTEEYVLDEIPEFADDMAAVGLTQLPLGTPADGDTRYGMARLLSGNVSATTQTAKSVATVDFANDKVTTKDVVTGVEVSSSASMPYTYGHNLVKTDDTGKAIAGYDDKYGAVLIGFKVVAGADDKIAQIWNSNIAVYLSMKCLTFEGSSQIG